MRDANRAKWALIQSRLRALSSLSAQQALTTMKQALTLQEVGGTGPWVTKLDIEHAVRSLAAHIKQRLEAGDQVQPDCIPDELVVGRGAIIINAVAELNYRMGRL